MYVASDMCMIRMTCMMTYLLLSASANTSRGGDSETDDKVLSGDCCKDHSGHCAKVYHLFAGRKRKWSTEIIYQKSAR